MPSIPSEPNVNNVELGGETALGDDATDETSALPAKYRVIRRRLSSDGSLAFEAEDQETGAAVFVKISQDADAIRREAKILEAISQAPGPEASVPKLMEWGHLSDGAFLVSTPVGGVDLEQRLHDRGERMNAAELTALMRDLAGSLDAVHRAGYIHRDLKPANIVLADDSTPTIVDFGAAMPLDGRPSSGRLSRLTHGYAAPEQYLKAAEEGPWTDVYALAAIAYRALFGRPPPPALARRSGEALLSMAGNDRDDDGTDTLLAAIECGLALDPNQRPSDAIAWADRLDLEVTAFGVHEFSSAPPDDDQAYPPTVVVERAAAEPADGDAPKDEEHVGPSPRQRRCRGIARAAMWTALAALVIGFSVWQARPLYERHLKSEWLIDIHGSGDAASLSDALRRGRADARYAVAPGVYEENVMVDGAQHLLAADPASPPVIAPASGPCLAVEGKGAVIEGLSFKPALKPVPADDPVLTTGCVTLVGTDVAFIGNRIADGPGPAITIAAGSQARVSGNQLSVSDGHAMIVRSGAEPWVSENTMKYGGVVFAEGARGALVGNRIIESTGSAVEIASGARPEVRDNTIEAAAEAGLYAYDGGGGQIVGNTVSASGLSGLLVSGGGTVDLSANEVTGAKEHGILIVGAAGGTIEGNSVRDSIQHGIVVGPEAKIVLGENILDGNAEPQVFDGRAE